MGIEIFNPEMFGYEDGNRDTEEIVCQKAADVANRKFNEWLEQQPSIYGGYSGLRLDSVDLWHQHEDWKKEGYPANKPKLMARLVDIKEIK